MNKDEAALLDLEIKLLDQSNRMLSYSYEQCHKIGEKDTYTLEELDKFEALTSRFARTGDVLIQKIFRLIDRLELEKPGSVIDRINRAEKRGLISSAAVFKEIRRLRNDITHEYTPTELEEMFKNVLRLTPSLMVSVEKVKAYQRKMLEKQSEL